MSWYANPDTALMPTTKIKADTRAWRADADRILGFWGERLKADRDACILTTEMLEAFNSWLRSNGHNEWSKELFGPRFVQHEETIRHGVEVAQPRHPKGLSRYGLLGEAPPRQARVYQGVRFQTASDEEECESDTGDTTHSENFSRTREAGSFQKGRVSRVRPPYAPCNVCGEQELWYPPSQERGVCERCWRAMGDPDPGETVVTP